MPHNNHVKLSKLRTMSGGALPPRTPQWGRTCWGGRGGWEDIVRVLLLAFRRVRDLPLLSLVRPGGVLGEFVRSRLYAVGFRPQGAGCPRAQTQGLGSRECGSGRWQLDRLQESVASIGSYRDVVATLLLSYADV